MMLFFLTRCFWIFIFVTCFSHVEGTFLCFPKSSPSSLPKQNRALLRDLILINYPCTDWRKGLNQPASDATYDVVIIGAGMAGLTTAAALFKEGISNIKLFDENPQGFEGPWVTYARMKTLRSAKEIMGPALGIPHLTFRAWFEAEFGGETWKQLVKIPNHLWMEYLNWYRESLKLPVENGCTLVNLIPGLEGFELEFQKGTEVLTVKARKVILATGRLGFGGPLIPEFAQHLPKSSCAHTTEKIDFEALKGRRVGVVGVGASAFDAAAVALEIGANSVDLLMRRSHLSAINKFASVPYKGLNLGYCKLSDEKRWNFMNQAFKAGIPPPVESIQRVEGYANFRILSNLLISHIQLEENELHLETNKGKLLYDFLILATGFQVDGYQQPELRYIMPEVMLWKDRLPSEILDKHPPCMGNFPYLGSSYEFLPKYPEKAPYLKNLYCYNYASTLSHGVISNDILSISLGATQLAQAIAADFFVENSDWYLECIKNYETKDFKEEDYLIQFVD